MAIFEMQGFGKIAVGQREILDTLIIKPGVMPVLKHVMPRAISAPN
jgi:hypothetical protein